MAANTCPKCSRPVMSYVRFLREAEPYRTSACGSCGEPLRRSPRVYVLLLVCSLLLVAAVLSLVQAAAGGRVASATAVAGAITITVCWGLLTNYLGYRLVGWVPARKP